MTATPLFHETARELWANGLLSRETVNRLTSYPITKYLAAESARAFQQLSDAVAQHGGLPGATGYRFRTPAEQASWYDRTPKPDHEARKQALGEHNASPVNPVCSCGVDHRQTAPMPPNSIIPTNEYTERGRKLMEDMAAQGYLSDTAYPTDPFAADRAGLNARLDRLG